MDAQAEKRIDYRYACNGTLEWVYFNQEGCGAATVLNFSQDGMYFESDQALVLGSTVLVRILDCMNCVEVTQTPANLRWNALAEVKWCQKLSGSALTPYAVGVRYHYPV